MGLNPVRGPNMVPLGKILKSHSASPHLAVRKCSKESIQVTNTCNIILYRGSCLKQYNLFKITFDLDQIQQCDYKIN